MVIAPPVVEAGEPELRLALAHRDRPGPVPAHVRDRVHRAGAVPRHDDRQAEELYGEVVTGFRYLVGVPDYAAGVREQVPALELEDVGGGVPGGGSRLGGLRSRVRQSRSVVIASDVRSMFLARRRPVPVLSPVAGAGCAVVVMIGYSYLSLQQGDPRGC